MADLYDGLCDEIDRITDLLFGEDDFAPVSPRLVLLLDLQSNLGDCEAKSSETQA